MLSPLRGDYACALFLLMGSGVLLAVLSFSIPSEATTYVSHDDTVSNFGATTARPSALGDRCYQETTGTALCTTGQTCIETGRTPWWDAQRGPYHVIKMKAVHTQLCTSLCCPEEPPIGTCYKKWMTASCATGYEKAFSTLLSGTLCCTTGSCFWFRTSLTMCDCPAGYESADRTDSCSANGWALCCPSGTDLSTMQLSDSPFETDEGSVGSVAAPPPSPPASRAARWRHKGRAAPPPSGPSLR